MDQAISTTKAYGKHHDGIIEPQTAQATCLDLVRQNRPTTNA